MNTEQGTNFSLVLFAGIISDGIYAPIQLAAANNYVTQQ